MEKNPQKQLSKSEGISDSMLISDIEQKVEETKNKLYDGDIAPTTESRREIIVGLLEDLLNHKEKFKNVFKTENGSTYFILNSGESIRIKKQTPSKWESEYEIQPLLKKIFFIAPEDWDKLYSII